MANDLGYEPKTKRRRGRKLLKDVIHKTHPASPVRSIFRKRYGCATCPYRGTDDCPHGVGLLPLTKDVKDEAGNVIQQEGEVKAFYFPDGVCPERLFEVSEHFKMCSNLDGIRQKRGSYFLSIEDDLVQIRQVLKKLYASQGMQFDPERLVVEGEDGDVRLVSLFKEMLSLKTKYGDQLQRAIDQESRRSEKEDSGSIINIDSLNNALIELDGDQDDE